MPLHMTLLYDAPLFNRAIPTAARATLGSQILVVSLITALVKVLASRMVLGQSSSRAKVYHESGFE